MLPKLPKGTLEKLWADPANWRGPIYSCKEDPRHLVPKRIRATGWTLNFAHPSAWVGILIRIAVLAGLLEGLKNSGYGIWMGPLLVALIAYSIWDGRRKSSPARYEDSA